MTLKDAVNEAMREWTNRVDYTHYVLCLLYTSMIIHNMNAEENAELTITDDMIANPEIRAELVASSPVDTVSYTHLDVYKRQLYKKYKGSCNLYDFLVS